MPFDTPSALAFHACHTDAFRVEYGVNRGEGLDLLDALNPGDIYRLKPDATWMTVTRHDDAGFVLDLAANMPRQVFTSLAELIFMTTTGRRADAVLGTCAGRHILICEQKLERAPEYVLIHIEARKVDMTPTLVTTPGTPIHPVAPAAQNIVPLRVIG